MTLGNQGEVSTTQIIYAILTMVVIGFILVLVLKIDLSKYFSFLPSFGNPNEDKVIERAEGWRPSTLQKEEYCCCLYGGELKTLNVGDCHIVKLELGKECESSLGKNSDGNWVKVASDFCFSEKICQYGYDDDKDGKMDCADEECEGKSCGEEKICIDGLCKDISVDEYKDYVFYLKVDGEDVTSKDAISLVAGKKYKFDFGYKVEGEKAEGIKMYRLKIKDSEGGVIDGKMKEAGFFSKLLPFIKKSSDEDSFEWTVKSGAFLIEISFFKDEVGYSDNLVKTMEKKLIV